MANNDPFDPHYLKSVHDEVFQPLLDHYFRPLILGAEKLPKEGPLLLAPNHSGNAFPYDGMVLDIMLYRQDGFEPARKFRSVFEKELAVTWWMRPFGIDNFWRRGGGIDLTFDNFDRILAAKKRMIYYPEGVPGIGKGFNNRYQLQRFSSSFIYHTARHKAPVFPVYIINAEWVIPFCYTFKPLDALMSKFFSVPFLPLPGALFGFLFPWCWYLALPVKLVMIIGDPIDTAELCRRKGITELEGVDFDLLRQISQEIRNQMQIELDRHVETWGAKPFDIKELARHLRLARGKRSALLPFLWPYKFLLHERKRHRAMPRSRLLRWLLNWDILFFFLPFGWPFLSLVRALRKPPFGYRGLSRAERRRRQGEYHWHLKTHPLDAQEDPTRSCPS